MMTEDEIRCQIAEVLELPSPPPPPAVMAPYTLGVDGPLHTWYTFHTQPWVYGPPLYLTLGVLGWAVP